MGWTAVEPLSPGFFQIDPSVMTLDAEGNRVFNVPIADRLVKEIVEELVEKLQKELTEEITEKATKEITEEATERITRESIEEAYEKVQANAMEESGQKLAGAALDSAVKKEAGELAAQKIAKESTEELIEEGGEQATKEAAELTAKQAAVKDTVDKLAQKGLLYGTVGITGFLIATNLLGPVFDAFGGGVGDLMDALSGENCKDDETQEERDKCEERAQQKLLALGAAGISLLGLFGALIITRLIPKKKPKEETQDE